MAKLQCNCGSTDISTYFDETSQRKIIQCNDCGETNE